MIRSKFEFQETKLSVRKMILTSGRNVNSSGEALIYIEIISFFKDGTRKTKRISTSVYVKPKNWTSKNDGFVLPKDPEHIDKNNLINSVWVNIVKQLEDREKGTHSNNFNPKNLLSIEEMFPPESKTLVNYIDDYIEYRKSINTPRGTLKEFTTCKNRIINYQNHINQKLNFEDINMTFSDNFYSFLLKAEYQKGTIQKTFVILNTILNYYFERREELNIKLSDKFRNRGFKRGEKSVNEPKPLSRNEFNILINHKFKSEIFKKNQLRFLLQCSTGMRYSDLFNVKPENIIDNSLVYYPVKTTHKQDNKVIVPLNPLSTKILKELNYDTSNLKISNQKYNEQLESMFKNLQAEYPDTFKTYTSHNGRDTFISYCIEGGIDVPSLLKMTGQETYAILSRYFKSTPEHLKDKMKGVKEFG